MTDLPPVILNSAGDVVLPDVTVTADRPITSTMSPLSPTDDLTIRINNKITVSGWQEIRVTRSLRIFPSSFDLSFTEKYPKSADIVVVPGDYCQIYIGKDLVLTGYVDRYMAEIGPTSHNIRIQGRSKCEDLFDCGTDDPFLNGATPLEYAQKLAKQSSITVSQKGKGNGKKYPGLSGNKTESPYRQIEVIARYSAFLVYDDVDGNLILADVNQGKHETGFTQGKNVQSASVVFSMDHRFSDYHVIAVPVGDFLGKNSVTGDLNTVGNATDERVKNSGIEPRHRPLYIVSPQLTGDGTVANEMALWEKNHRYGQSSAVRLVCDSWRDGLVPGAGKLWQPNFSAPIDIPTIFIDNPSDWVIGDVTYRRSIHSGTTAEIVMMPAAAFSIQPTTPIDLIVQQGINQANKK